MRVIKKIHGDKPSYWVGNGFRIQTLMNHLIENPDFNYSHTDPFLLLDYGVPTTFIPNPHYDSAPHGIGQHPHRGFEAVTVAYAGEICHADSTGASGIIREGDVQWMTAGRGITHEEFHSPAFGKRGGVFSMAQMWINLPQTHKLTEAKYQSLKRAHMPNIELYADNNKQNPIGSATIIAGHYQGISGTAATFTPINLWDIALHTAGTTTLDVPNHHNVMILVQEGELLINDELVNAGNLVQFKAPVDVLNKTSLIEEAAEISLSIDTDSITLTYPTRSDSAENIPTVKLLLLSGEPIGESIAAHGPFVMTTQEELKQAFHDYRNDNFG
ncbi:pirin family protein [Psychrobacter urativorans]|uniref:Short-chain dehydrogenase n=1 Tax=Psychrobacter urativorans TaxID=45610 RepID=A0A0M4TF95_9GAMM|nr:pirin family protein [Psychrobacter urativorans]ALF59891.1 short-chain dehydrogenase [Psychrobacter urativorans]